MRKNFSMEIKEGKVMEGKDASPAEIIEAHQKRVEEFNAEEQIELAPHEGELEFWDKIMRSTRQPIQRRMKAAELSAQYRYPRQAAVATASISGKDFASLLEKAIQRSGMTPEQVRETRELRLIEGGKEQIDTQTVEIAGERR
jgi:hypothetical protein